MAETFEQYRKRLLGYLGTRDPIQVQRRTPGKLERLFTGVSRTVLTARATPRKWSATEIVAHLADAELAMSWRLRSMIASPGVSLPWWDEGVWAVRLRYQFTPWRESLARFKALRLANLALLRGMPTSYWDQCYGSHEKRGRQTVRDFVTLEAAHDLNHLRQIESLVSSGRRKTP
jgi:hypothetical protein